MINKYYNWIKDSLKVLLAIGSIYLSFFIVSFTAKITFNNFDYFWWSIPTCVILILLILFFNIWIDGGFD